MKSTSADGMRVVLSDIEEPALTSATEELRATGADVLAVVTDTSVREQVDALADRTLEHFGAVHVVCNNAGVSSAGLLDRVTYGDWDWILGVNLGGVVNGVQTFVKRIKAHGDGGHIVNTGSMAGLIGPLEDKGGIYPRGGAPLPFLRLLADRAAHIRAPQRGQGARQGFQERW